MRRGDVAYVFGDSGALFAAAVPRFRLSDAEIRDGCDPISGAVHLQRKAVRLAVIEGAGPYKLTCSLTDAVPYIVL
ncbi:hypothetical protein [Methylobacterium sp. ID0610]|uniref:hypothetical protein n=1 Tax=Methylobacterium carpenticola TaxID=3344827 RepID=UPI0036D06706